MLQWRPYCALILFCAGLWFSCHAGLPHRRHRHVTQRVERPAIDFRRDVESILATRCCRCHGPKKHKAGLRLDTAAAIHRGADAGAVIVPGESQESLLISVLTGGDDVPRMPPSGPPLTAAQVAVIRSWIDTGAAMPPGEAIPERTPTHWAFRPPVRASLPRPEANHHKPNPIDALLSATRKTHGLVPNPPASREVLLRRIYLDLTGLPPSRAQLHAFRADHSAEAYERVVDRLLASPRYGERWARHWMDIWRYSDPDGRKAKKDTWWSNQYIWRWRDWIVRSLNQDRGYDRMVVNMLAGDEAEPGNPDALAATGFLVRDWFKLDRNIWMNNTVEHTAKAFLGVTINCARCHNHKFDPISQKDYYRFRALFEPYDVREDGFPIGPGGKCEPVAHAYDLNPDAKTWIYVRGDVKTPDHKTTITPGVPIALGGPPLCIQPVKLPKQDRPSTGRRLALARWLTDRRNPLTARVAVNHIWARHFGTPLVENVYDFGTRTKAPAQQALLDCLAVQFMDHGWSMKWLHRLIVTSDAYRMSSSLRSASTANLAVDPENHYYWRMNDRPMEAEVIRDSLLSLSGELDLTMGGPPVDCFTKVGPWRRSLYYRYSREDKMEFLTVFDCASTEECYRRQRSIVPQQALALENSDFVWDRVRKIAHQLDESNRLSTRDYVVAAFEQVLGRSPDSRELSACEQFLSRQTELLSKPSHLTSFPDGPPPQVPAATAPRDQAREHLVHALVNHNDFITVR